MCIEGIDCEQLLGGSIMAGRLQPSSAVFWCLAYLWIVAFSLGRSSPWRRHFVCGTALSDTFSFHIHQHELPTTISFCVMLLCCTGHSEMFCMQFPKTTDFGRYNVGGQQQHNCVFYPTMHRIIFKPVSHFLASEGKCSFNSWKLLEAQAFGLVVKTCVPALGA